MLVNKALEIIAYFSGANWAFENPQSGLLPTRDIVRGIPFADTSFCRYGYSYRKNTRIWTNLALCVHTPCTLSDPCSAMVGRRHPKTAQQSRRGCDPTDRGNVCSQRQLYSIPAGLCDEIAEAANLAMQETDVVPSDNILNASLEGTDVQIAVALVPEELRANSRSV